MPSTNTLSNYILFDTGMFIGALLRGDKRHTGARPLVEAARMGTFDVCTTSGSMDGSDIPTDYEIEILSDFEQYLGCWIVLLKEAGQ